MNKKVNALGSGGKVVGRRRSGLLTLMLVCGGMRAQQPATLLIGDKEARSHIVSGVDAVYPMIAQLAHVRGVVVIRANVSAEGKITHLNVVSGAALLQGAAIDAVRGWRFAPFQLEGHDGPADLELKIAFPVFEPLPQSKMDAKVQDRYVSRLSKCHSSLDRKSWTNAVESCEELVTVTKDFPQESVRAIEILGSHEMLGRAFAGDSRMPEALEQFRLAVGIARSNLRPVGPEYGEAFCLEGSAEVAAGDLSRADADFGVAEKAYRGLASQMHGRTTIEFDEAFADLLARHAVVAEGLGRSSDADAMREEAEKLDRGVKLKNYPVIPERN